MANTFQIQRLKKTSSKLKTQGLDILGDSLNNLSFIYNTSENSFGSYIHAGDGVYIGKNPVVNNTKAWYTTDLEKSYDYNYFNYLTAGKPGVQPPRNATITDTGVLYLVMPSDGLDSVYTRLSFRSLADASTTFGDVNKIIKWGLTDEGGTEPPTEIHDWLEDHPEGVTMDASFTMHYTEDGSIINKNVYVAYTNDASIGSEILSTETTNDEDEDASLRSRIYGSLTSVNSLKGQEVGFANVWVKAMTNAYTGVISNIKWSEASEHLGAPSKEMLFGDPSAAQGPRPEPTVPTSPTNWGDITDASMSKIRDEYIAVDELDPSYIEDHGNITEVVYQDLFNKDVSTITSTNIGYTGPSMEIDQRVWRNDNEWSSEPEPVVNVTDSIVVEEYTPTNVWDEINYRFKIINENFRVLANDINQSNIMLMEDTVGTLIPAIVTTTNKQITVLDISVASLDSSVATMGDLVTGHDASIVSQNTRISVHDSSIAVLDHSFSVLDTSVNTVTTTVGQHDSSLLEHTKFINTLDSSIEALDHSFIALDACLGRTDISIGWDDISNQVLFTGGLNPERAHNTVISYLQAYADNAAATAATGVDMSNYVDTSTFTATLNNYVDTSTLNSTLENYVDASTLEETLDNYFNTQFTIVDLDEE